MKSKGFTLVEVVIVLLIMGILLVGVFTTCIGPRRIAMAAEVTPIAQSEEHCTSAVLDVIAPVKGCPVKQMLESSNLTAHVIYLKSGDWTDDDVDMAFNAINGVVGHFTEAGVPSGRVVPTFTNTPDWRKGINLDKGDGLYIVIK